LLIKNLKNEKTAVPSDIKIQFINKLSKTGLKYVEATSFVSPKWVPQVKTKCKNFLTFLDGRRKRVKFYKIDL
jgi:isopropylmalate/homocitrate/citramalate synthase